MTQIYRSAYPLGSHCPMTFSEAPGPSCVVTQFPVGIWPRQPYAPTDSCLQPFLAYL